MKPGFSVSDHSSDIIRALGRGTEKAGAQIHLHTEVKEVCTQDEKSYRCITFRTVLFGSRYCGSCHREGFPTRPQVPQEMDIVLLLRLGHKGVVPVTITGTTGGKKKIMSPNFRAFPSECGLTVNRQKSSL